MLKIIPALILLFLLNGRLSAQQNVEIPFHNLYADNMYSNNLAKLDLSDTTGKTKNDNKKSVGKAALFSLLIPGGGEYYMGATGQAKVFFAIEVLLWGGLFANKWYVGTLEDDYKTYAVQYASVERDGKDDYYWVNIGKFNTIYDYNTQRARDRNFNEMYTDTDKYYWSWQSKNNRITYDGKRLNAENKSGNDVYFYSAILLNHFVSVINAIRLARKHNKTLSWRIDVKTYVDAENSYYYGLSFCKHF